MRLGSCLGIFIDLIRPFGFLWDDKHLQRAGMDYLDTVEYRIHESFDAFLAAYGYGRCGGVGEENGGAIVAGGGLADSEICGTLEGDSVAVVGGGKTGDLPRRRIVALEADNKYREPVLYHQFCFKEDDIILAGSEHDGFAEEDLERVPYCVKIPMLPFRRSLNVAVATAMVTGEAMRQIGRMDLL